MFEVPVEWFDHIKITIVGLGLRIIVAVLVLAVGFWFANRVVVLVRKAMDRRNVERTLRPFLLSIISVGLKIVVILTVLSMLGLQMTSFIAVLGSAGLAIGLALQGSLSNFAGGVLILLLKPFRVGHLIDTGKHLGVVREIRIFYTYLTTAQNQEVIIPNGQLSNNSVINFNYNSTRRMDMQFGIGYHDDIDLAKKVLQDILDGDPRILQDKPKMVFVQSLGDSAVVLHIRAWLSVSDFGDVTNSMNEWVKKAFDKHNISIPFPQHDVHIKKGA